MRTEPRLLGTASRAYVMSVLLFLVATPVLAGEDERKLPEGVTPLPPEMQKRLDVLQKETAKYRGLPLKRKVLVGRRDESSLKKKLVELFQEELPAKVLNPMQKSLKSFGFIPTEMDLAEYYPKLLTSQVAGYYDSKKKYLILVDREGGILGGEFAKRFDPAVVQRMEESTLVHEINHAIQDQHFDLDSFGHDKQLSDAAVAKLALIEGDAMLVTYSFMMKAPMESLPGLGGSMKMLDEDPEKMLSLMPDMPGAKELLEAPAFIRENLIFSYTQGMVFCLQVKKKGGQKLLRHAFTADPPRSSEQILHPEKWTEKRDDPIALDLPELKEELKGFKKTFSGSWGEFNTRLMLMEQLGKTARAQCLKAAEGWGGDAFALYEKDGKKVTVWVTEWDSVADAREFQQTANQALKKDWNIVQPATTRVTLVRGTLPADTMKAVQKSLANAKATVPANKAIDLAALGITAKDLPKSLSFADMQRMMNDPFLQGMMKGALGGKDGKVDITKMLDNPAFGEMVDKVAKEMLGENAAGMDFKKLMKNPMVGEMLKQMLGEQGPAPRGKTDAGVYTNLDRGLRIQLPKAKGWKINDKPQKPPMGPAPMVVLEGPEKEANVMIMEQVMPMAFPIEQMGPMLEMGVKLPMQNYKKIKGGLIKTGPHKGYELEYTGTAMGESVHAIHRFYLIDGRMLVVAGTASTDDWDKHKDGVTEALKSFSFVDKAKKPDKAGEPKPAEKKKPTEALTE